MLWHEKLSNFRVRYKIMTRQINDLVFPLWSSIIKLICSFSPFIYCLLLYFSHTNHIVDLLCYYSPCAFKTRSTLKFFLLSVSSNSRVKSHDLSTNHVLSLLTSSVTASRLIFSSVLYCRSHLSLSYDTCKFVQVFDLL